MDSHEEEKEPLIEKSHAAGGGANLTAANTRDKQPVTDENRITFDGKTYNVDGRKFVEYQYALKSINVNPNHESPNHDSGFMGILKTTLLWVITPIALVFAFFVSIAPMLLVAFIVIALYACKVKD